VFISVRIAVFRFKRKEQPRRGLLLRSAPSALPGQTFVFPIIIERFCAGFVGTGAACSNTTIPAPTSGALLAKRQTGIPVEWGEMFPFKKSRELLKME
jgi:hypothetical protein